MASLQTEVRRIAHRAVLSGSARSAVDEALRRWRNGELEAAITILRGSDGHPMARALAAVVAADMGKCDEATAVDWAEYLDFRDADTWTLVAAAYWMCGSLDQAVQASEHVVQIDPVPSLAMGHTGLGSSWTTAER